MKSNLNAILFSIAIVIASIVLGKAYVARTKVEGTITVTGLGKKDFSSDLIVWDGYFSKVNSDLKLASAELNTVKGKIEQYLTDKGISAKEIVFSAVEITEKTTQKYNGEGKYIGEDFEGYQLMQSVQITSNNVEKIEAISRTITELLNDGIQFYSEAPRYYFTKLSDLKLQLIEEATTDAYTRALKIAEKSGGEIGDLKSAQMGIYQITGQNSDEEYSWGGTFNTSSKEKSASITMKLNYEVE